MVKPCSQAEALFLLKNDPGRQDNPGTIERGDERSDGTRIRCPRCAWEPSRHDQWMCVCLHVWNTFETGGVCPACGHEWTETQCPRCQAWSPHLEWYVDDSERSS